MTLKGARETDSFGKSYETLAEAGKSAVAALADAACARRAEELYGGMAGGGSVSAAMPEWYVYGREAIASCVNYENDAERVGSLSKLLPVIFFLVAALVSLNAMTRLVEEQRPEIGTLKALGCGNAFIFARYLCYALFPTFLGSVAGVLFGEKFFPFAILNAYSMLYAGLRSFVLPYNLLQGGIAVLASVLCTSLATAFASTLKVLGFYDTEVGSYIYKENILLTVIGIAFGLGLGVLLHSYVFSAFINLVMYRSIKKINMVESLKSVE